MFDVDITIHKYEKSKTGRYINDTVYKISPSELIADYIDLDEWLDKVRIELLKKHRKEQGLKYKKEGD